jgi:hypothetical protein
MKSATILDVLRAVTRVAREHPEVEAWWYAPALRLRVAGDASDGQTAPVPEVAIDAAKNIDVDEELLSQELQALLEMPEVRVRRYEGAAEPRTLFRLVTTRRDA